MRRLAVSGLIIACFATQLRSDETLQFGISVVINDQEVVSTGGATYSAPTLCLDCRHWGNHRINGASASVSWSMSGVEEYQRQLTDWITTAGAIPASSKGGAQGATTEMRSLHASARLVSSGRKRREQDRSAERLQGNRPTTADHTFRCRRLLKTAGNSCNGAEVSPRQAQAFLSFWTPPKR
jgi:hypothetical protein